MKREKWNNLHSIFFIFSILIALFFIGISSGNGPMNASVRIGYVSHRKWDSWSARYQMLSGVQRHAIGQDDIASILDVQVVTESGNICIEMNDEDGNVVFKQDAIETSAFTFNVSGKISICVNANKHKGSFNIVLKGNERTIGS